jgi:hypothetical protein
VVGKWGGPKGRLTQEDKEKMWLELGGESGQEKRTVFWPKRESRLNVKVDLEKAGLPDSGVTNYAFGMLFVLIYTFGLIIIICSLL